MPRLLSHACHVVPQLRPPAPPALMGRGDWDDEEAGDWGEGRAFPRAPRGGPARDWEDRDWDRRDRAAPAGGSPTHGRI